MSSADDIWFVNRARMPKIPSLPIQIIDCIDSFVFFVESLDYCASPGGGPLQGKKIIITVCYTIFMC